MRAAAAVHDLALALMIGGIAGVGLSITVTFARAPNREIAGQVGNAIFGILAPAVLAAGVVALGARLLLHRSEEPSTGRALALILAIVTAILAAVLALWLTPRMGALWSAGTHASDGSGLAGEDRVRFLRLHGLSNVLYLAILLLAAVQMLLRAVRSR